MSTGFGAFGLVFGVVFVLVTLLIVAVFVFMVVATIRRTRAVRAEGLDPLTGDIALAGQLSRSQLLAPASPPVGHIGSEHRSTTERLAEVDELLRNGVIDAGEHQAQRARILGDL